MIKETITTIVLKPEEGMRLTNGTDIAEKDVWLGVGDSPDNWHEITEEEAKKIEEERNVADELLPDNC